MTRETADGVMAAAAIYRTAQDRRDSAEQARTARAADLAKAEDALSAAEREEETARMAFEAAVTAALGPEAMAAMARATP